MVTAPQTCADVATVLGPARLAFFTPVHEQPTLADRKAMFILAASGLMASVLLFFSQSLHALITTGNAFLRVAAFLALVSVAVLVLTAAVTAYYSYTRSLPSMPPTLAWFRNLAAVPLQTYSHQLRTLDHPAAVQNMLQYNYSVASLAARKFRLVNRALRCLRVAIPLWMVLLLVLAVWG